jgi:hypothetical protein
MEAAHKLPVARWKLLILVAGHKKEHKKKLKHLAECCSLVLDTQTSMEPMVIPKLAYLRLKTCSLIAVVNT